MRRYSADDEERLRAQGLVREWTASGLIEDAQGERLAADLRVDLRRTNPFLRAGLAFFPVLIVAALTGRVGESLALNDHGGAVLMLIAAACCAALADYLVGEYRLYRFGIEEALAACAVVLLGFGSLLMMRWAAAPRQAASSVAWTAAALGAFGSYRRFGFAYAAIAAMACAAAVPFQPGLAPAIQRLLAALALTGVLVVVRSRQLAHRDDYLGEEYGDLHAAALAGVYLVLNVKIAEGWLPVGALFHWSSYVAIWVLPLAGLRAGLRDRDRPLMNVSLILLLVTLVTNKPYLGWARNTWDPIILGAVLIAAVVGVRRWLALGPDGERNGLTAARILDHDRAALSVLATVSAIVQPGVATAAAPPHAAPGTSPFGGGRSGGGGGGAGF